MKSHFPLNYLNPKPFRRYCGCVLQAGLLFLATHSFAQYTIRPSETGSEAAAARKAKEDSGTYFLKAGPIDFSASAGVEIDYNDNVNLGQHDRLDDVIIRPDVELDGAWRVTELNTLRFNLGLAYSAYMQHSELDTKSVLIDPNSEVSFDIFVGGFLKLTLHDRFSILQNPIDDPNLSNTARFDRFQNSAGITALFDLNAVQVVLGYDHFDYRVFDSGISDDGFSDTNLDYLNRREEQIYGSVSVKLSDAVKVGADASGGFFHYLTDFNNDGSTWSVGPFFEVALSNYTTFRLTGGYQVMTFDGNGTNGDMTNYNGFYGNATIAQRLNQYVSHSLSAGHEARLGLDVNFAEYTFARYAAQWHINSHLNAAIDGFVERSNESGEREVQFSEDAFRFGLGLTLDWRLGKKVSAEFAYHYVNKNSNLPLRDYYQNIGTFVVRYDF